MNTGPLLLISSASEDELINLSHCRIRFKLGQKSFEYYFQIIKNLKRDLILSLNFQKLLPPVHTILLRPNASNTEVAEKEH